LSNPHVSFDKIQYSRENKTMYIYSKEAINTNEWYHFLNSQYIKLDTEEEIIKKLDKIMNSKDRIDTNCISLYDVVKILRIYDKKFDDSLNSIYKELNDILIEQLNNEADAIIVEYNDSEKTLGLFLRKYPNSRYKKIVFIRENGIIKVKESDSPYASEMLEICEKVLHRYYDFRESTKEYCKEFARDKKLVDGELYADVYRKGVHLSDKVSSPNLKIISHINNSFYTTVMEHKSVEQLLSGKNSLLFKKAYINIEDLPNWLRNDAYNYRINEVKMEIKRLTKERRKSIFDIFKTKKR